MTAYRVSRGQAECASTHYSDCALCEHRCHVDRSAGETGFCKAGPVAHVFRHRVEYGEELELIPSHLFYLSGCDLRCGFCIAGINAFDPSRGVELTSDFFNRAVNWGRERGARNIQWVGGEPTIHLPAILDVMSRCPALPPVVWKSDFYSTPEVFKLLNGAIDVYVADFKFGNDACARRIAGIDNYMHIVTRNLKMAAELGALASRPHPARMDSECGRDAIAPTLIVRHLLLPGHAACCYEPVAKWLAEHLPDVRFSLRDSYLPSWRSSRFAELARPLDPRDGKAARAYADRLQLEVIQ